MSALWADLVRFVKGIPLAALLTIGFVACIVLWIAMMLSLPRRPRGPRDASPAPPEAPWYYTREGRIEGPLHAEGLSALVASGTVAPDARVWRKGCAGWIALSDVPALRAPPTT
jgi:hypothetical protein